MRHFDTPGRGGIAVIRVSGPDAFAICGRVWSAGEPASYPTHTVHYGPILDCDGEELDQGVMTIFRGPHSYTGEDTVELSVHGSTYIQRELLRALIHRGARMAEPGEYTRRASANGRLDLTQAEGVADIIAADTAAQHLLATSQLKGAFSEKINNLRQRLIELASLLELELDFSEEDVEFAPRDRLTSLGEEIIAEIDTLTAGFRTGTAIKEGIPVAIIGTPNAGKSTLLNQLLADERAIVSDIPGTTRDTIEDTAVIEGTLFRFIDTAGLRHTTDTVEAIGIRRALDKARHAGIILWLIDPTAPAEATETVSRQLRDLLAETDYPPVIIRLTGKQDLVQTIPAQPQNLPTTIGDGTSTPNRADGSWCQPHPTPSGDIIELPYSSKQPSTLQSLRLWLSSIAEKHYPSSDATVTNLRHYESLRAAAATTAEALQALRDGIPPSS